MTVLHEMNGHHLAHQGSQRSHWPVQQSRRSLFWGSKDILVLTCFGEGTTGYTWHANNMHLPTVAWAPEVLFGHEVCHAGLWSVASCGHLDIQSTRRVSLWWQPGSQEQWNILVLALGMLSSCCVLAWANTRGAFRTASRGVGASRVDWCNTGTATAAPGCIQVPDTHWGGCPPAAKYIISAKIGITVWTALLFLIWGLSKGIKCLTEHTKAVEEIIDN